MTKRTIWRAFNSEMLVFAVFIVFAGLYAVFIPSFEGPDESEHCRYIQAYAENAKVHPVDPKAPYRWGYQVHHPPLYYWLMGQYAKLVRPAIHGALAINPAQNPRFPFIRHDLPGQRFPFDEVHGSLRLLRLPSVMAGILTFLVLCYSFKRLFPDDRASRCLLLTLAMLVPNSLQLFGIVANDGLNLLFSVVALFLALKAVQEENPSLSFFFTGLVMGLGILTKQTTYITLATIGTIWGVDAVANHRLGVYLKGLLWALLPLSLLVVPFFYANHAMYGDVTRERLLRFLTPAFYFDVPRPAFYILTRMVRIFPHDFLADLCWQSLQVKGISRYFFWFWFVAAIFSVVSLRSGRGANRVLASERAVSIIAIFWSAVFLVLANRHWMNLQVRFFWCVYPFTVAALVYTLRRLPIRYRRWRRFCSLGTLIFVVILNTYVLMMFRDFYRHNANQNDRDYETFLYSYITNRKLGDIYLRSGEIKRVRSGVKANQLFPTSSH